MRSEHRLPQLMGRYASARVDLSWFGGNPDDDAEVERAMKRREKAALAELAKRLTQLDTIASALDSIAKNVENARAVILQAGMLPAHWEHLRNNAVNLREFAWYLRKL